MSQITTKQTAPIINNSIEYLHNKTQQWISEIEFIKIEQDFLGELLAEHVLGLCTTQTYKKAKLLENLRYINKNQISDLLLTKDNLILQLFDIVSPIVLKLELSKILFLSLSSFLKNLLSFIIECFKISAKPQTKFLLDRLFNSVKSLKTNLG